MASPLSIIRKSISSYDLKVCFIYIEMRLYLVLQRIYTVPDEYEMFVKHPSSQVEPYRTPNC